MHQSWSIWCRGTGQHSQILLITTPMSKTHCHIADLCLLARSGQSQHNPYICGCKITPSSRILKQMPWTQRQEGQIHYTGHMLSPWKLRHDRIGILTNRLLCFKALSFVCIKQVERRILGFAFLPLCSLPRALWHCAVRSLSMVSPETETGDRGRQRERYFWHGPYTESKSNIFEYHVFKITKLKPFHIPKHPKPTSQYKE